jgi:hypothetical protein
MTDILMTIVECANSGRYVARVDGHDIVTTAQPLLDGARALIAQGYDPTRRLVMRRPYREQVDLVGPLGVAAGLTVESSRFGRPNLRPFRRREGVEIGPPVRKSRAAATQVARNRKNAPSERTRKDAA